MSARNRSIAGYVSVWVCLALLAGCASQNVPSALLPITPNFMLSEHDRAEKNLKDPKSLNLAYGKFQEQIGQVNEARKSYEMVLRDDPKSVDAILGLARLDQLAEKPKEAEAGFLKARQLRPGDPAVLAACGQFYASTKHWPEAFQALNAAIAAAPKQPVYKHELAVAKTRAGDIDAGIALFTELVGPEKARYNVAFLLRQQGQTDAAVQQCRMALAINPSFEPAKALLGQLQGRAIAQGPQNAIASRSLPAPPMRVRPSLQADYSEAGTAGAQNSVQSADGMDQQPWPSRPPVASNQTSAGAEATFMPAPPQTSSSSVLQQPVSTQPAPSEPPVFSQPKDPFRGYSGSASY
jgi:Tfp pilus assembly protein PilF